MYLTRENGSRCNGLQTTHRGYWRIKIWKCQLLSELFCAHITTARPLHYPVSILQQQCLYTSLYYPQSTQYTVLQYTHICSVTAPLYPHSALYCNIHTSAPLQPHYIHTVHCTAIHTRLLRYSPTISTQCTVLQYTHICSVTAPLYPHSALYCNTHTSSPQLILHNHIFNSQQGPELSPSSRTLSLTLRPPPFTHPTANTHSFPPVNTVCSTQLTTNLNLVS